MRFFAAFFVALANSAFAQQPPYDLAPEVRPPYYRVRHEASVRPGELAFPVSFTLWVPPGITSLRGVIVHQHGCGEGSCKSGFSGAFDLHWQSLALKHNCALLSPVYEQPEKADCQLWCDPRRGSDVAFQQALKELSVICSQPELALVPWVLWGHSGGGHWAGGMVLLHPDRVAAAWLRSGVPPIQAVEGRPTPYPISEAACAVPVMCNLGSKEGVTDLTNRFAGVWPGVKIFFKAMRAKGALIGIAIDPLTSHECGNQRYLAIPWLDACLTSRLRSKTNSKWILRQAPKGWLTAMNEEGIAALEPVSADKFIGLKERSIWLPTAAIAQAWSEYVKGTAVIDTTPPPTPRNLQVKGNQLNWEATADIESGLAQFIIERDGQFLDTVPEHGKNPYGRPVFQNLQYSDTPTLPLVPMHYIDRTAEVGKRHRYRVIAVNTVGLRSK